MNDNEELKLRKDMERGAKAEKLLNDPMLSEAFQAVKDRIHEAIELCPLRDVDGLVSLRLQLKSLEFIKGYLETTLRDGKLAAEQIRRSHEATPVLSDFRHRHWRARA